MLGAASSGDDISKEISRVARSVHMTSRGWTQGHVPQRLGEHWPNLWYHPTVRGRHTHTGHTWHMSSCRC